MSDQDSIAIAAEKAANGKRAKQIMEDPMVSNAFREIAQRLTDAWTASRYEDSAGREACYRQLRTLKAFEKLFEDAMAEGEVSEYRIRQFQKEDK